MIWIALPAWFLLRAIAGMMSAAALGCVTALLVSTVIAGGTPQWFKPISTLSVMLAAAFGIGAIGGLFLLPPIAVLRFRAPDSERASLSALPFLMLFGLLAFAAMQTPPVAAWWQANHVLAEELTPGKPDPVGWDILIEVIVQATPLLASLAVVAVALSAILAMTSPPSAVTRLLGASLLICAGLTGGLLAVQYASRDIAMTIQTLVDASDDALAKAQVTSWLGRYAASGGAVGVRLLWLLGGLAATFGVAATSGAADVRRP